MDFETRHPRTGTYSAKWDDMERRYGVSPADGLAMWIADMDFSSPPCVIEALKRDLDQGVLGYYGDAERYFEAVQSWMTRRHGWTPPREAMLMDHGTVQGAAAVLQALTEPGDEIVMLTPIYMGLRNITRMTGREAVEIPLEQEDDRYIINFDSLEARMTGAQTMMLFCSPLNPGGRVWSREELRGIADFCRRHQLILVSDEVHHDLVMPGHEHIPMPLAAPEMRDQIVMLTGPGKSFNLAGGMVGNVTIENEALRRRFQKVQRCHVTDTNRFGMIAAEAAYRGAEAWLEEVIAVIARNQQRFNTGLNGIPGVRAMELESTYLAWVDFTNTGIERDELHRRVRETARIAANDGLTLGDECGLFLRFNLAAPTSLIDDAVARLQDAFADLQ